MHFLHGNLTEASEYTELFFKYAFLFSQLIILSICYAYLIIKKHVERGYVIFFIPIAIVNYIVVCFFCLVVAIYISVYCF
jgi:hypothetical protein